MQFKDILHNLPEVKVPSEKKLSFNTRTNTVTAGSLRSAFPAHHPSPDSAISGDLKRSDRGAQGRFSDEK